jgi:3-dehydroquinate synthase
VSDLTISSSSGSYDIDIAVGIADRAAGAAVVLVDPVVRHVLPEGLSRVVELPASEETKTLGGTERVLIELNRLGVRRGDVVAAVGGGVVQDVATLAASLYMRGLPWEYYPTTLMAMADSCIGGKSSINAGGIKNLVGNFYPPRSIAIDPRFVPGLPAKAIAAGMAEAVKICFARGRESFETYLGLEGTRRPGANDATAELLRHVLSAKKWFVEIDEFDRRERQLLNFGHSFGHAWEAACGFAIPHGVGVAIGMMAALRHPAAATGETTRLLDDYCIDILTTVQAEVRAAAQETDWAVFAAALRSDKKNTASALRLILPAEEGVEMRELELDDIQIGIAASALRTALEEATA